MLSMEFIPTSPSEYDQEQNSTSNLSFNTITTNTLTNKINSSKTTLQAASSTTPLNYSTVPESIKFIPQPPVQFFYSLQKNSLRTVIDTLLSTSELGSLCTVFKVPCYGKWLKKRVAADMLVDHLLTLKQAYQRDQFNVVVERINTMKGKEMLGRIPSLPEKINALQALKGSLYLLNKLKRPTFPVRLNYPLKEVTGLIFLDEVEVSTFALDLNFTIPAGLDNGTRLILCLYQSKERTFITSNSSNSQIQPVSPTLLDLTLNGSILEQGTCRFRNHDSYDITLFCYKDQVNLLRILRHETHVDLRHLVIEIVAINIAGSLSETRPGIKRTRVNFVEDEEFLISNKFLRDDLQLKTIKSDLVLKQLRGNQDTCNSNSDELELLEDTLKFSLKCPISLTRISIPVRFITCNHAQCFDLTSWQQLTRSILNLRNQNKKNLAKINCPICFNGEKKEEELQIDGLFKKILDSSEKNDVSVELYLKDGNFKFIKEEPDSEYSSDEDVHLDHKKEVDLVFTNNDASKTNITEIISINNTIEKVDDLISISLTDSSDCEENDETMVAMLSYKIDKTKPIGSCPSRAITLD